MGLIDKLLGRNEKQTEESKVANNQGNSINFQTLQRRNGTSINIMPVLDKMGNQIYQQVFNNRTNELQLIPRFTISSPELRNFVNGDFAPVLIDIDKEILNTLEGAEWVANGLLSSERLEKVFNQYRGYAGGLTVDQNGQITGKYVDQGIIDGIKISKEQEWKEYQARQAVLDEKLKNQRIDEAKKYGVNIKTSHAEPLSLE